ncbi:hypothetical protein [Mucisphaera sp.]|uniref:hypothetical protein n=1 Tax=Mucisphaera sp. TaxID=2913024 RepID=UPI003D0F5DA8
MRQHRQTATALVTSLTLISCLNATTHVWDGDCAMSNNSPLWSSQCDGLFGTLTNWDTDEIPGSGDSVIIANVGTTRLINTFNLVKATIQAADLQISGSLLLADTSSIEGLTQGSAGEIFTTSRVNFTGTNTNNGVFLRGTGSYANQGTFTVVAPITARFINNETVNFAPGERSVEDFVNNVTANLGAGTINGGTSLTNRFELNGGMLNVDTGSSTTATTIGGRFELTSGTVNIDRGQLEISGLAKFRSGTFLVDEDTDLSWRTFTSSNHQVMGNVSVSGDGNFFMQSTEVGFAGQLTVDLTGDAFDPTQVGFQPRRVRLSGTGSDPRITNRGFMSTPSFGTDIEGNGVVLNEGTFEVSRTLRVEAHLINTGTMNIRGTAAVVMPFGGIFENQGTIEAFGDGRIDRVTNDGTLIRDGAGPASAFTISNYSQRAGGTTTVEAGELRLTESGTLAGTFEASQSALLQMRSGSYSNLLGQSETIFEGQGSVALGTNGTSASFTSFTQLTLNVGSASGSTGAFRFTRGFLDISDGDMFNNQNMAWAGGNITIARDSTFYNRGLLTIEPGRTNNLSGRLFNEAEVEQGANIFTNTNRSDIIVDSDATWKITGATNITAASGGIGSSFSNDGTLTRSGPSGSVINLEFENTGRVVVEAGTLSITNPDPLTFANGVILSGNWEIAEGAQLFFPEDIIGISFGTYRGGGVEKLQELGDALAEEAQEAAWQVDRDRSLNQKLTIYNNGTLSALQNNITPQPYQLTAPEIEMIGGTIEGDIDIDATLYGLEGTLRPGYSPGIQRFLKPATLNNFTIEIELAGTQTDQFDQLHFDAGVHFTGSTFEFHLIDNFEPQLGDRFAFLQASTITGAETLTHSDTFPTNLRYDILTETIDSQTQLVLLITDINAPIPGDFDNSGTLDIADLDLLYAALGTTNTTFDLDASGTIDADDTRVWIENLYGTVLGDANLDRTVDLIDLSLLASSFNTTGTWGTGDFSADNTVDLIDLSLLASNFGQSAPNPIPEPSALLALLGLATIRRG